jgi:hypothetical protein
MNAIKSRARDNCSRVGRLFLRALRGSTSAILSARPRHGIPVLALLTPPSFPNTSFLPLFLHLEQNVSAHFRSFSAARPRRSCTHRARRVVLGRVRSLPSNPATPSNPSRPPRSLACPARPSAHRHIPPRPWVSLVFITTQPWSTFYTLQRWYFHLVGIQFLLRRSSIAFLDRLPGQ